LSTTDTYEVFAVKYATREARRIDHFLDKSAVVNPDAPMPMDYFVWVIRNPSRTILVDTGFSEPVGTRRGRQHLRRPVDALKLLDIDVPDIDDIVLTHMHYDHAGTLADLPGVRVHLQEQELRWVTGRELFERKATGSFEVADVVNVIEGLYGGRVHLHQGDWELAPGVSVHLIGGHTPGIQVLRVNTARGAVVVASDTTHYYENMETGRPFATTYDAAQVQAGFKALHELADSPQHIVPGHDPLVMRRYPAASGSLAGVVVRLDAEPSY
jgi:glyoxylase-like metal-dependent hydrolase (beta-lactamase superfamily II)